MVRNLILLKPVVPEDLVITPKKLKNKNSYGFDEISTKIVKDRLAKLRFLFLIFLIAHFRHGLCSMNVKVAKITPIFKSGEKTVLNNYIPISLLQAFSKLLEKVVCKQLWSFLNKFSII